MVCIFETNDASVRKFDPIKAKSGLTDSLFGVNLSFCIKIVETVSFSLYSLISRTISLHVKFSRVVLNALLSNNLL